MKIRILAGAACAALTVLVAPASAAAVPYATSFAQPPGGSADQAVAAFYASRQGAPLWLRNGPDSVAARQLIAILQRASLDGLPSGPALAGQAATLLNRARNGDPAAPASAERLLSTSWVLYVQALQQPPAGMTFTYSWVAPRRQSAQEILARAAAARSLQSHVANLSAVNPIYAQLRDAAWQQLQATGGAPDPRVLTSLDRSRTMPFQDRYIMVDTASAQLWMVEGGRIADAMKVIVGKPSTETPMLGSVIYYATLNPYWNVPPELVQRLIAPRVLKDGLGYLRGRYEVLSGAGEQAQVIPPSTIDWKAVADGRATVRMRELPGPANSMGKMKFGLTNSDGVFLHDTPKKELFDEANRTLSNGCIRLEDAQRLGRWLLGREPYTSSPEPEQQVALPKPMPVYITYLTARAEGGRLTFVDDVYGQDARVAALN